MIVLSHDISYFYDIIQHVNMFNPGPAEPGYRYALTLQTVYIQISWLF